MIKNLESLKEGIFRITDEPVTPFFRHEIEEHLKMYEKSGCKVDDLYFYCIYIQKDNRHDLIAWVLGELSSDNKIELGFRPAFAEYINKYQPATFMDVLLLLDLYWGLASHSARVGEEFCIDDFLRNKRSDSRFPVYDALETILENSRGILLWHYQLEQIVSILGITGNEAVTFRKGLNAGKCDYWERLEKFNLKEGENMADFVISRMIYKNCTRYPNIDGAMKLYELISGV